MQMQISEPNQLPSRSRSRSAISPPRARDGSINVRDGERLVSVVAGSAAIGIGLSERSLKGTLIAALGAGLVHRGVTGQCKVYQALGVDTAHHTQARASRALSGGREAQPAHIDVLRSVTVQKSVQEVYDACKRPEILTQALAHLATVSVQPSGPLRLTVRDPLGREHTWDMQVVDERRNERIEWRTAPGESFTKAITFSVRPAPGDRGTELALQIRLEPMSGPLGRVVKKLFGKAPAWVAERALGNIKSLLEAGELPSLANNPSGRSAHARGGQS